VKKYKNLSQKNTRRNMTIKFKTDNAAFEDGFMTECARILRELATELEEYGNDNGPIRDINGNTIGSWTL
jgi:hypothetical protein